MSKKRILITGASGSVAKIAREVYSEHEIELWSTRRFNHSSNEEIKQSADLVDFSWWENPPLTKSYDIIFHFAEPVKRKVGNNMVSDIVKSHVGFLAEAIKCCPIVVYPLTAYMLDNKLSGKTLQYRSIKQGVARCFGDGENVMLPIIHPIIDSGKGLNVIRKMVNKLPLINLFSEFKAELPVLYLDDLKKYLLNVESQKHGVINVYSCKKRVCDLFRNRDRRDSVIVSLAVLRILEVFGSGNSVNLLLRGRSLHD